MTEKENCIVSRLLSAFGDIDRPKVFERLLKRHLHTLGTEARTALYIQLLARADEHIMTN